MFTASLARIHQFSDSWRTIPVLSTGRKIQVYAQISVMNTEGKLAKPQRFLEIACFGIGSAIVAAEAGVDRIELCSGPPSAGGLTPSLTDLQKLKDAITLPVHVMIRPRSSDFVYTENEFNAMKRSIAELRTQADGFVFGILDKENRVDIARCEDLLRAAGSIPCVFHRAIDEASSYTDALSQIARLGFKGVLTSGRKATAVEGVGELQGAVKTFEETLQIIVGGGVRAANIETLLAETGATWYHSSALVNSLDTANGSEIVDMLKKIK